MSIEFIQISILWENVPSASSASVKQMMVCVLQCGNQKLGNIIRTVALEDKEK